MRNANGEGRPPRAALHDPGGTFGIGNTANGFVTGAAVLNPVVP